MFKNFWLFVIGAVVLLAIMLMSTYNGFVTSSQQIDGQWAQVETQYQRRYDLIPNLVNSVKGIFNQEKEVFTAIADARTRYSGAQTVDEKAAAATQVESALSRLLVIVENYPQLQSNQAVQSLMDEIAGTENRVSVERKRYNDIVLSYNTKVRRFPGNMIAAMFGFTPHSYFEAVDQAVTAPKVEL